MKMDFTILKSFIAVAEEKSFSEAAKHLFIAQQSLSKQIAKLEEELDTSLFVRSRPLGLTPDGRQFLQTAKGILQLKRQYEENSSKSLAGSHAVHVGIEHTVARAILPHVLPRYLHEHEDTYVRFSEESPEVLQKAVSHDGVDLVIGTLGRADAALSRQRCRRRGAARAVAVDAPVRRIHPAFRRGAHGNDDIPRQFPSRVLGSDRTYLDNRRARLFPLARAFCEARAAGRSRHARPVLAVRADVDRLQKSPARDNRRRSARARGLAAGHRRRGRCAVLLMLSRRQLRIPAAPLPQLRAVADKQYFYHLSKPLEITDFP